MKRKKAWAERWKLQNDIEEENKLRCTKFASKTIKGDVIIEVTFAINNRVRLRVKLQGSNGWCGKTTPCRIATQRFQWTKTNQHDATNITGIIQTYTSIWAMWTLNIFNKHTKHYTRIAKLVTQERGWCEHSNHNMPRSGAQWKNKVFKHTHTCAHTDIHKCKLTCGTGSSRLFDKRCA